ncbi:nucleotide exchange factor GrpE [Ornithinibacillus contaminans]|uniref:nucleotide exchange factor GrpE n=1 Tax=Ornithinibacillus contaminans TaxID=694055 RepID=UPI00064DFF20|nr:nucleotide exchange factor GrpE [Ornithinibacillus contaminans]
MEEKNSTEVAEENVTEATDVKVDDQNVVEDEVTNEEETEATDNTAQELARVTQEKDEIYQRLLRTQAEFDNFKKRTQKEKEADRKYKAQDFVTELLPAIDNFERAMNVEVTDANKGLLDGLSMVYRQLKDALVSQGVGEIETVGKPFDPNLHQAVMQVEDDEMESNTVVEELQKGYVLKDRVIRPAMVKVNK